MTGQRNVKIPMPILLKSFPKAILDKLGEEKTFKLCTRYNYRSRKHVERCPGCGGKRLQFRSTTHDLKCMNPICHMVIPVKNKQVIGLNTSSVNPIIQEMRDGDYYDD
jgi:hypothetical protein